MPKAFLFLLVCVGFLSAQPPALLSVPAGNLAAREKVVLGRKLFFDTRLSRTGVVACGYCHDQDLAFSDGKRVSEGVYGRNGTRNAPTLINRGASTAQFWDGRAASLEEQVLKPLQDNAEMGMTLREVTASLGISERTLAEALAGYVRSIRSGNSRVDQGRLTPEEEFGSRIFRGKGNCIACHSGPNYTDERFHNTGVGWKGGSFSDNGRFAATGDEKDRGAFKTPTLREIGRTAPYMHDGSLTTLEEAIDHFNYGGIPNPGLDPRIRPLHLTTAEKQALAAFLRALDGEVREGPD
jgi:cytochrome c peroxidase